MQPNIHEFRNVTKMKLYKSIYISFQWHQLWVSVSLHDQLLLLGKHGRKKKTEGIRSAPDNDIYKLG